MGFKKLLSHHHLVVLDTEWTSWAGFRESSWNLPGKFCEIVQIGAVKLDAQDGFKEVESFSVLVKPLRNPILSDYFIDLTGITQRDVDANGRPFAAALDDFISFSDGCLLSSFGGDEVIFEINYKLNDLPYFFHDRVFINVAPMIGKFLGRDHTTFLSSDIPELFGFPPTGVKHQAVDDARCTAQALVIIGRDRQTKT